MRKNKIAGILVLSTILTGCSFTESMGLTKIEPNESRNTDYEDGQLKETLQGRWYYDNLTEEEQDIYNAMYAGFTKWDEQIELDGVHTDTVLKVFNAITMERPELYYVGQEYHYTYYNNDQSKVFGITPNYMLSKAEYEEQMLEVDKVADKLKADIEQQGMGEFGAEQYVHDYLVNNVDYFTEKRGFRNTIENFRTIYGALVEGKANCMGYTRAMTYVMNKVGIECTSATGDAISTVGSSGPHEWNIIKINGNWYHLDVCWDDPSYVAKDGINRNAKNDSEFGVRHTYFNLTTAEMGKSRRFDNNAGELPECTSEKDNYYVAKGFLINSIEDYENYITSAFSNMIATGDSVEVRFINKDDYVYAVKNVSDILDKAATANNYYGRYMFQGYPDERSCVLVCRVYTEN